MSVEFAAPNVDRAERHRTKAHGPAQSADCNAGFKQPMSVQSNWPIICKDSETWTGNIHTAQALHQYRDEISGDAKLVDVDLISNGFTLLDRNEREMLDVLGFDTIRAGRNRGLCPVVTDRTAQGRHETINRERRRRLPPAL